MTRSTILAAAVTLVAGAAAATEPADDEMMGWSLGAGFGASLFSTGGLGGLSGLGGLGGLGLPSVYGTAGVEYRVTGDSAIEVGLRLSASRNFNDYDEAHPMGETESTYISATVGYRWIANPGARAEIGFPIRLSGGWAMTANPDTDALDSESSHVQAVLGMTVDVRLLDNLVFRMATALLSAALHKSNDDAPIVSAGLDIRPEIQLRVHF